jgi:hypothetical protein
MWIAPMWPRLRRESILLAVPVVLAGNGFPLNELALDGSLRSRLLEGRVSTAVHTPIGRIPVHGRVVAHHACDGTFTGTVTYSRLIRLAARLRGISLVTALNGRVHDADGRGCDEVALTVAGQFHLADSLVVGDLRTGHAAWVIIGVVRAVGDTAYHATLDMAAVTHRATVSLDLYER